MKIKLSFILCLLCCSIALAAPKKKLVVLDFSANNIEKSYARIVRNKIELALYKQNRFNILEKKMALWVIKEKHNELLKCSETSCAIKIGKYVSADYVVMGSIDALDRYTVTIRIIDVNSNNIVSMITKTYDSKKALPEASSQMAMELANFTGQSSEGLPVYDEIITESLPDKNPVETQLNNEWEDDEEDDSYAGNWGATLACVAPVSSFKDKANYGIGTSFFLDTGKSRGNFRFGFEAGFYSCSGNTFSDSGNILSVSMIPITASARYYFYNASDQFFFAPAVSLGLSINFVSYDASSTLSDKKNVSPLFKGGFAIGVQTGASFGIRLGAVYCKTLNSSDSIDYILIECGFAYGF
ncbi:MAG: hypothetical protein GY754_43865 [bacterium]|nr:hypothetical protein [bacterium]